MKNFDNFDVNETITDNSRGRALRRHNNIHKAIRKKRISDSYSCFQSSGWHWYKHLNQYNKGKIHCSCPLCRAKTNNTTRKGSYVPHYNPKHSQAIKDVAMDEQLEEYMKYGN